MEIKFLQLTIHNTSFLTFLALLLIFQPFLDLGTSSGIIFSLKVLFRAPLSFVLLSTLTSGSPMNVGYQTKIKTILALVSLVFVLSDAFQSQHPGILIKMEVFVCLFNAWSVLNSSSGNRRHWYAWSHYNK